MAVLLVQLQAPDAGLYSIPWTDCTDRPSGTEAETQRYNRETLMGHNSGQTFTYNLKLQPDFIHLKNGSISVEF